MSGARFTSGCWYGGVGFSADCPEKPPLKSLPLPALVKPVIATGSRHLPAPPPVVGGVSLTSSLPSLLQAPPRGLSYALPSISWTKSLDGGFMAQRGSPRPRPRPLLGAAGEGSSMTKAGGAAGAVAVHPFCTLRFSPNEPSAWCGCTSCSSHPLPLTSSCQLVSRPPSPTIHVVWMAA